MQKSKLENYQYLQMICIWGACICGVLATLFAAGIKFYDNKIKLEESAIKIEKEKTIENIPTSPTVHIVGGDYIAGDKIDKSNQTINKKKVDKSKTEINKNEGINQGNIGGSGNTVTNHVVNGDNFGVNGPVNVNYEKPFTDEDKANLLKFLGDYLIDFPEQEKKFTISVFNGSNAGRIPMLVKEFLIQNGWEYSGSGMSGGEMHDGILLRGQDPNGGLILSFGHF